MYILLVNTNPVISQLISLNARNDDTIHLDEIGPGEKIPGEQYDILFVDEKCCNIEAVRAYLQIVNAGKRILFSSQEESDIEWIDIVIKKPFLPAEIAAVLHSSAQSGKVERAREANHLPSDESVKAHEDSADEESGILDNDEIEKIKMLLFEEEGLVEVSIDEESERERSRPEKKNNFEENLLEALAEMKPKKIRKLLKGAKISITIKFPKGE